VTKQNIFLYAFIAVVVINVGLIFIMRQSSSLMNVMNNEFEDIKRRTDAFKSFDDSLAGSENFRKRLLDTISTVTELRQQRENERDELAAKIEDFRSKYPNQATLIRNHKVLDAVNTLMGIVMVCMAIPVVIYVFKRR
jgi:hypothetical protein